MHTWFWSDGLKEKDNVEDLGVDERIIGLIKCILNVIWVGGGGGGHGLGSSDSGKAQATLHKMR
jgi:hypothetical protein